MLPLLMLGSMFETLRRVLFRTFYQDHTIPNGVKGSTTRKHGISQQGHRRKPSRIVSDAAESGG